MKKSPSEIVDCMFSMDAYSQWLGIVRISDGLGSSHLQMLIRKEMCNGFEIAHGGISYAFADSAFAFAANGLGQMAVSINGQKEAILATCKLIGVPYTCYMPTQWHKIIFELL